LHGSYPVCPDPTDFQAERKCVVLEWAWQGEFRLFALKSTSVCDFPVNTGINPTAVADFGSLVILPEESL